MSLYLKLTFNYQMKENLALLLILFCLNLNAQVNYEKSYFIDNGGSKTECFIKNKDKSESPSSFEYKLKLEESQILSFDVKNVKEVKIGEVLKYERSTVKLDTSNVKIDALDENREPEWKEVTVFLKVLVESQATLYEYKQGNSIKYFYKVGNSSVEQLIYKKYIVETDNSTNLTINSDFQKQLWTNLNFGSKNIDEFLKMEYNRKDLIGYFIDYNKSKNNDVVDFSKKMAKGSLNFKVNAGIASSSLSVSNSLIPVDFKFSNKINSTFGTEAEYIMPFNRNKWSVFLAVSYNSYKNETDATIHNSGPFLTDDVVQKWNASFSYLDFALGFRHYMFINNNSKMFISGNLSVYNELESDIHNDSSIMLNAEMNTSFGYGIGYSYKNKFNVELKRSSPNIFANYIYWNSNYSVTSVIFGYTIFDSKKKKH